MSGSKETSLTDHDLTNTIEGLESISVDILHILEQFLVIPMHTLASAFGVVTNVINMAVMYRLGLTNSMSVGVFALSVTDFIVTFVQLGICICNALDKAYPDNVIKIYDVGAFGLGWIRYMCFFISSWITTVISVERCFCVVFPFQVKRMFTKTRCVVVVIFIYATYIGLFTPFYFVQRLNWSTLSTAGPNSSLYERLVFRHEFYNESVKVELFINTIGAVSLAFVCQCLLITCTLWMTYALMTSSKVRNTGGDIEKKCKSSGKLPGFKSANLTWRERNLVKIVLCLAVLYTLCNVPRYAVQFAQYAVPGMNDGLYQTLSPFLWDVADFFGTINCSCNFFVYFLLNTNFKKYIVDYLKQIFDKLYRLDTENV